MSLIRILLTEAWVRSYLKEHRQLVGGYTTKKIFLPQQLLTFSVYSGRDTVCNYIHVWGGTGFHGSFILSMMKS